ncbi:MAG: hydrogenase maturation protease [Desulfobacterales bacterium]
MHTLIIGLGNELLGDEGVGVHAVRALEPGSLPAGTAVLEVGTAILDAVDALTAPERIIVIDAMKAGGRSGTVYRIPLSDCGGQPCIASMHGFDIFRVLALAGRTDIPEIIVFGVEPHSIAWSMALSHQVQEAIPQLLEAVRSETVESIQMSMT